MRKYYIQCAENRSQKYVRAFLLVEIVNVIVFPHSLLQKSIGMEDFNLQGVCF